MTAPGPHRLSHWLAPALWFALGVVLARVAVLVLMEHVAHESPLELVRHRVGVAFPGILLRSLVLAIAAHGLAHALSQFLSRRPLLLVVAPVLGLAAWSLMSGIGGSDASRAIGLEMSRGQMVAAALGIYALALSVLGLALATSESNSAAGARPRRVLLPVIPLIALGLVARLGMTSFSHDMALRDVVQRPRFDESWRVVNARTDAPPRAGTITPSVDYALDGADLQSIILPPPAAVRFMAPPESGLWLTGKAGIDHEVLSKWEERFAQHSVRFELSVSGKTRFTHDLPLERVGKWASSEWVDIGPGGALAVEPNAEILLRTTLLDPKGAPMHSDEALTAGFGGLTFERRWTQPREMSSPDAPNLVLILMDTQRADRMSVYGYERDTTPRLRALAERGVLFEHAQSTSSWTWPSTASVLTGQLPQEHGVTNERSCFLDDGLETLAESLQRAGFTTAAFSANPLIVPDRNFHQGFELFDHGRGALRPTEVVLPPALDWLEAVAGKRFFLYLHIADPHSPLEPRPEARELFAKDVPADFDPEHINNCQDALIESAKRGEEGRAAIDRAVPPQEQRWISDLYDACVWSGDHHVGLVLDKLEELGLTGETVVAFTSDHGEDLFDHGFATHGQNLYGTQIDVPLIVAGPGFPTGARVSVPVSNRHLGPSLAARFGANPLSASDPLDLFGLTSPSSTAAAGPVYFSTEKGLWNGRGVQAIHGVRAGDLVLHWAPGGGPFGQDEPAPGGAWQVFDRSADPDETLDLRQEAGPDAAELRAALEETVRQLEARRAAPAVEAGSGTLDMLRAIGYLEPESEDGATSESGD